MCAVAISSFQHFDLKMNWVKMKQIVEWLSRRGVQGDGLGRRCPRTLNF